MYEKVEIHCRKFEGDCLARAERQLSASVSWLNSFPITRLYKKGHSKKSVYLGDIQKIALITN